MHLNTFSISARCSKTGQLGVAVSTAVPGVGGICPFIKTKVGSISTQSWVNPYLGIDGLNLLEEGKDAKKTLDILINGDPDREVRQIGIVDANGLSATWTGKDCVDWAGHLNAENVSIQGNMLVGEETINAMYDSFKNTENLDLKERLMLCLEAGQNAGGDKRGKQSAAIKVFDKEEYPYLDLRVDEHHSPVSELRRVFEISKQQYTPFITSMPTRENLKGNLGNDVSEMLLMNPGSRPGGTLKNY